MFSQRINVKDAKETRMARSDRPKHRASFPAEFLSHSDFPGNGKLSPNYRKIKLGANRTPNTKVLIKSSLRRTATPNLLRERETLLALRENCRILLCLQRISVLQCEGLLFYFSGKWFEIKESKSKILK